MRADIVFLPLVVLLLASGVQLTTQSRVRHHRPHEDSNLPFEPVANKTEASGELKKMLQTSPKDALIVTKRRYLRKDWCKSQPLIQRIGQDHCLSTTVLNRFCYGQCNSFYIPKNQLKADGQQQATGDGGSVASGRAFKSCAVCQPKKTSWVTVTLKCPSLVPNIRRRRVQIINQCRCMQESPS